MKAGNHVASQRAFYESGEHQHLRPREDDRYACHLAGALAGRTGIGAKDRVLEVGAGFGRFSFPLLEHVGALVALDLSPRVLEDLERTRADRGIPVDRLRAHCADVDALDAAAFGDGFDAIVGFYFLHHLRDFPATLARLTPLLRPGGRLAFLEPNRWNPLFLAQVACCPDMHWSEEKGMFRLSRGRVEDAYRRAGLGAIATETFGFFPPPLFNRFAWARRLERRIERVDWLRPALPYLLLSARAPGSAE